MGRAVLLAAGFGLIVLAGCAKAPSPNTDPGPGDAVYLRGVETEYSVPIASLGDLDLLGPESVMRQALVAGDRDVLVAATTFAVDGVLTLDVIVLNRSDTGIDLARSDLHLVDAQGRWLTPRPDFDGGAGHGLRGRGARAAASPSSPVPGLFDTTRGIEPDGLAHREHPPLVASKRERRTPEDARRDRDDPERYATVDPGATVEDSAVMPSPTRVRVRPDDGKAFWGYFEPGDAQFPLTALVLIDGEQHLFRFER